MLVTIICPSCRRQLEYNSDQVDSTVVCSACSKTITVSRPSAVPPLTSQTRKQVRPWQWLVAIEALLLLGAAYWLHATSTRLRGMSRPVIVETNVVLTNMTTNVEVVTNIVRPSEPVSNPVVTTPAPKTTSVTRTNAYSGPKVELKGYNIVMAYGIKYAHAVVQNVSPLTLKRVTIRFEEIGVNRRGPVRVGTVSDSTSNLGPYQFWEVRKPVAATTLRIQLIDLTTSD